MRSFAALCLPAVLAFGFVGVSLTPTTAAAQTADAPIEQRMSADEFKAAGLDKLSAAELANLNRWLNGTLKTETAKATQSAIAVAKQKAQGFFDFDGNRESIRSTIVGDFRGFSNGRVYKLANGQEWEQVESAELNVRKANPGVELRPGIMNSWWMLIDGYNTRAKVRRIK